MSGKKLADPDQLLTIQKLNFPQSSFPNLLKLEMQVQNYTTHQINNKTELFGGSSKYQVPSQQFDIQSENGYTGSGSSVNVTSNRMMPWPGIRMMNFQHAAV